MNQLKINEKSFIRDYIQGSARLNNIFWAFCVSGGGLGFFLMGLSTFLNFNLLFVSDLKNISFLPQGIVLIFYGTVGLILGVFLWLTIFWDVGYGYNEYNKKTQQVILYRKGFPGKNREFFLKFNFSDLKSIKILIRDGLNPKRQLLLCLNDNRQIPLTGIDKTVALNKIETSALVLAKYLNLYLESE
ncbi:MAG: photosystem I assembly protein Ycf4 [Alphaproteobacteria bacterium]|jgi:hypothetical protein|nr:photosystem I assembly protein Ycf4 [Alphaproteobacteria bacterium]